MSKKVYAIIMVFAVLLMTMIPFVNAENVDYQEDTHTQLLVALEIIDKDIDKTKEISRVEFLKTALQLTREADIAKSYKTDTVFKDVKSNDPDAAVVSYAYDRSYIVGHNGSFMPGRTITVDEANTILFRMTGYSYLIDLKGIFYVKSITGINDGLDALKSKMTYDDAHRMIYNILEAPYYENILSMGDSIQFGVSDEITIMGHFLDVYVDTGILTAANKTHIKNAQYTSNDAMIGENIFDCKLKGAEEYVGYRVKYYYYADESKNELKAIFPYKNDVLALDANDLCIGDADYSLSKIVYENEKGRVKSIKLAPYADVIYNGEAYPDYTLDTLKPLEGKLVFLDNNTDGMYDVVVMDIHENFFIKSVDSLERRITAMDGRTASLQRDSNKSVEIFGADGSYYEFADIGENNIVSLCQSKSGRKTVAYVSSDVLFDEIENVDSKGNVTVGGKEYELDMNFKASAEYAAKPITIHTKTGLYLDRFGKIAAVGDKSAVFNNYGYLCRGIMQGGLSQEYLLKVYTDQGKFDTFRLKDKVTFNGTSQEASTIYNQLSAIGFNALIKYEVKPGNILSSLELAEDMTGTEDIELGMDRFTLDVKLTEDAAAHGSRYRSGILGSKYLVQSGSTVVFNIPNNLNDEYSFSVGNRFSVNDSYNCDIYDLNDVYCAGAIVIRISSGGDTKKEGERTPQEVFLVDSVRKKADDSESGETRQVVAGWQAGVRCEYTIKNKENDAEQLVDDLKPGDVIKVYASNSFGEVTNMERIIRLADKNAYTEKSYNTSDTEPGAVAYMQFGRAGQVSNGCFTMSTDGGITVRPGYTSAANIYVFYKAGRIVSEKGDVGAITAESSFGNFDGDEIFVNKRFDQVVDIIVVKDQ